MITKFGKLFALEQFTLIPGLFLLFVFLLPSDVLNYKGHLFCLAESAGHSLWITGLTASYRAADLKLLFSKCGKVDQTLFKHYFRQLVQCAHHG